MANGSALPERERTIYRTALALVTVTFLVVLYLIWPVSFASSRWESLGWNLIPNAIVAIVAIPIAYLFLSHSVGAVNRYEENRQLAREVANEVGNRPNLPLGLTEFHPTFRSIDWKTKLDQATTNLDIVVYYFDSWVNSNFDALRSFMQRPKTRVRVFVSDPDEPTNQKELIRNFPEYSLEVTAQKVRRTGERLARAQEDGGRKGKLEFRMVHHPLGYSAQCFDNHILILSVFEMCRDGKIGSPAFVIDLQKAPEVAKWWEKELVSLEQDSHSVTEPMNELGNSPPSMPASSGAARTSSASAGKKSASETASPATTRAKPRKE